MNDSGFFYVASLAQLSYPVRMAELVDALL